MCAQFLQSGVRRKLKYGIWSLPTGQGIIEGDNHIPLGKSESPSLSCPLKAHRKVVASKTCTCGATYLLYVRLSPPGYQLLKTWLPPASRLSDARHYLGLASMPIRIQIIVQGDLGLRSTTLLAEKSMHRLESNSSWLFSSKRLLVDSMLSLI